jgi:hypothetical protein
MASMKYSAAPDLGESSFAFTAPTLSPRGMGEGGDP